ncbi:MAG TPA: helix-turn-helix transcriptional regulator [Acidimicrobiia bacterium]
MDATQAGRAIREWRGEKGWSQSALAEAAGLSVSQIQNIEAGRRRGEDHPLRLTATTARQLADAFGMPYGIRVLEMYGYPEQIEDFRRSQLVAVGSPTLDDLDPEARKLIENLISILKRAKPDQRGRPAVVVDINRGQRRRRYPSGVSGWAVRPSPQLRQSLPPTGTESS